MKFELYQEIGASTPNSGAVPDWRWRLKASNGNIVAEGGEGYRHAHDMVRTIKRYVATTVSAQGALARACIKAGLTTTGRQAKTRGAA